MEVVFKVTARRSGYAHTVLEGTYTGPATVEMVVEKFTGPFGHRQPYVRPDPGSQDMAGRWGIIRHED